MSKRIYEGWEGFEHGTWVNEINLRSFIRHNFTPYDGDESFLEDPTEDTLELSIGIYKELAEGYSGTT